MVYQIMTTISIFSHLISRKLLFTKSINYFNFFYINRIWDPSRNGRVQKEDFGFVKYTMDFSWESL
jgi:hypothetical protein